MKQSNHAVGFLRRQYLIVLRRCAVLNGIGLIVAVGFVPHPVFAQSIVPDGRTATTVTTSRNVSDITTATIAGPNAFNSFSKFNVANGEIANLRLPSGTTNLINIVRDETSFIDGVLNSVKDGKIGGNVFFANPYGMVVGANGVLNVGSISVSTPTKAYVDGFFTAHGRPDPTAVGMLLDGMVPISPSGLISIRGRINAIDGIDLHGGRVDIAGALETGARFSASADFANVVNLNGVNSGTRLVEHGGRILIAGDEGVSIGGSVSADGGEQVAAGEISITSKGDIDLRQGALISARGAGSNSDGGRVTVVAEGDSYLREGARIDAGAGDSGDGGHIELSGKGSVIISGGILEAAAPGGKAGSVLIDPIDILWTGSTNDVFHNTGTSYTLIADRKIALDDVVISTRNVGGAFNRSTIDSATSIGNSGSITMTAQEIELKNGTRLLANADNGHQAGDISLTASLTGSGTASILLNNAQISGKTVSLLASANLTDSSLAVSTGITPANAGANIDINSSRIAAVGGNLQIAASTVINATTNTTLSLPAAVIRSTSASTVNVHGDVPGGGSPIASQLSSTGTVQLSSASQVTTKATPNSPLANLNGDAAVAVSDVSSTSTVHVGDGTTLSAGGALSLSATNAVDVTATADASAAGSSAAGAAVAYSKIVSVTRSSIDGQASITQAASLDVSANATNSTTVTAKAAAQGAQQDSSGSSKAASLLTEYGDQAKTSDGGVKVAGALGISDLDNTTQAYLAASGPATVSGAARLSSKATSAATVTADASATNASSGVGVAVGINLAKTRNQAYLAQNIDAASLDIEAVMAAAPPAAGNVFSTTVTSGAGATNVGVAGSLAVNLIDTSAEATVNTGATATLHGGDATLTSDDVASSTAKAVSSSAASGGKVGVGASVAINVDANRSTAEIRNSADIIGAGNVSLQASLANTVDTEVEAGAAGGIAVTPAAAISVVNNRTLARLGTVAGVDPLVASGNVDVGATQTDSVTTKASGNADGSKAAIGAAVAVNVVNDEVLATTARSVTATTGGVSFTALGDSASSATAKASAAGGKTDDDAKSGNEDADVDSKVGKQLTSARDQQSAAGVGDSAQQGETGTATAAKPSASTSEGKLTVAAAIGVNIANSTVQARNADNAVITAGGTFALKAQNNTDGEAVADGTAVGSAAVGIGAAVAVNKVKSVNDAVVGLGAHDVHGLTVEATMRNIGGDQTNTMKAAAAAGAGASKVGVAGSLALNLIDTESRALLTGGGVNTTTGGATVEVHNGDVSFTADNQTSVSGTAKANATAGKVGIGASVAVDVVANNSLAEIADGSNITHARDISLTASGTHSTEAETDAGSAGGVSITPSVALAVVDNQTKAVIGKGGTLTLGGNLGVSADHTDTTTTSAKADAGGGSVAIGASLALNVVNDASTANTARDLDSTGGSIAFSAHSAAAANATAKASASGGKNSDEAGQNGEDATVDDKITKQKKFGTDQQKAGSSNSSQTASSASSSEGKVAVAAGVGVNVFSSSTTAEIRDGLTIAAHDAVTLEARSNTDAKAIADGTAVGTKTSGSSQVGIGAGVALNTVTSVNKASIGASSVISNGLSVTAETQAVAGDSTNTFEAEAKSGAGGSKVGIAGSVALNIIHNTNQASIATGADVNVGGGNLTMRATNASSSTARALPGDSGATGGKVGIGASVAINLITDTTEASIADQAKVQQAGVVNIAADSESDTSTIAESGAAGGVALDAVVALATLNQATTASVGAGLLTDAGGAFSVSSHSAGTHTATATGDTKSGNVGVGASAAVIVSNSTTTASIDRNISTGGDLTVHAGSERTYEALATASAKGAAADQADKTTQNGGKSSSVDTLEKNKDSQQGTQGGAKVQVAAAVGVTVMNDDTTAKITGGRTLTIGGGGNVEVSATSTSDFASKGSGEALDPNAKVGIGVGVGLSIANNHTTAAIEDGTSGNHAHLTGTAPGVAIGDVTVAATSSQNQSAAYLDKLSAEGIAGAGAGKVGVAGSLAVANSNTTTSASIGDNTRIDQAGAIEIEAENTSSLSAKAWAGAFGSVGVGASVATVVSNNRYTAILGGGTTHVTADSLKITARNNKFSGTPFTLSLGNIGDLSDEASIKAKFTDITDQLINGQLLGGGNYYTEAAAGAAGDRVAVAGSFAVNVFKDVTDASIGAGATVNAGSGAVDLTASNDAVARSLAGSASAGGSVGVGVSSADVASTNITRSHIDAGVTISNSGSIQVDATNKLDVEVIGIAAAASNSVAVGGVANVITLNNSADAYVAGSPGTALTSSGNFTLGATNSVTGINVASGLSASGSVGVGIAAAVNTVGTDASHQFGTHAYIGDGATVNAGQHTRLTATASEDLTSFAIAGAASGSVSVGGAAVTNVMNTNTRAYVGSGAKVNKGQTLVAQSASLNASDTTSLFDVIVGVGLGGTVGVGASGDVGVISKTTQAYLGSGSWLETAGNLQVQADARENFNSIAIGLGVGGTAGGAGSVSVYDLATDTEARVDGGATLRVRGNALVAADDITEMNLIAGSAAGGGTGAIGAAAGVTVFDKNTLASIGDLADVEVLGLGGSDLYANTGDIAISFGGAIGGNGQVKSSSIAPKDAQGNDVSSGSGNAVGDRNAFQGLTRTRSATPVTSAMRGLAVTATNRDKLESFSVTGAAGGGLAITLGGNVAVLTTDTEASIGSGARINQNGTPADAAQSVRVAAGNDQFHIGLAGAASGAGGVAAGAGVDVMVANNTVTAAIGKDAKVKAARNVEVLAHGQGQYLEMGAGLAAAGSLAIAGSVGVISINNTTHATIVGGSGATTQVDAGGNVRVTAGDDTETDMITGAAAAGFGTAGVGVAVGVNVIAKDTSATIGDAVSVNALGGSGAGTFTAYLPGSGSDMSTTQARGLQVQASSREDLFGVSASGAAGLYAGVSGAVTVTTVASNTTASIGNNARINLANGGAASDQDVNVSARNQLNTLNFTGSVAVAGGAGISGGFDIFTAKNNTSAGIGSGSEVHAARDVVVNALSGNNLRTTVVSAAGGLLAGVAGGISVYSVGDKLGADSTSQLSSSGDVKGEADSQARDGSLNDSLLGSSTDARVQAVSAKAKIRRAAVSTDAATTGTPAAGNSATIGDNAKVFSGRDVAVNARGTLNFNSTTGAAAVGALGLGAGIGIANFTLNNQARIGTGVEITAGGDLLVHASLNESARGLAFAGSGGIVAINADWSQFNDDSTTLASIGNDTSVHQADLVQVTARDVRNLDAQAIGASVGALAAGASVATTRIGGSTTAAIGSGTFIGAGTDVVGSLDVSADSRVKATSSTLAAAGGIGAAASGSAATATAAPTVTAYVADNGNIDLTGGATVRAVGAAGASADALGFSVAGGIGIGASVALARSSPQISAYLGSNTVLSAASLTVSAAHELPDFLYTFDNSLDSHLLQRSQVNGLSTLASASGTSGGLLLGATGTDAEADYGSTNRRASVTAHVGDNSSLTVPDALNVTATNDSSQNASTSGLAFGIAALGSNDAYARSNSVTYAGLGKTVHVAGGVVGATSITAQGTDRNIAHSVSGSGGVIAGAAASANTVQISDTRAWIDDSGCGAPSANCGIVTGSFTLSGSHDSIYNGKVDSTQASVAGASGASNSHNVSSVVNVGTGSGVNVTAGDIAITGTNASHKYWWGQSTDSNSTSVADAAAWNVNSGSGGLLNLPAGRTVTTINQRTRVSVGDDSVFHVLLPVALGSIGAFTLDANNIIVSYDKTKLDSGGAIALAESNSLITAGSADNLSDTAYPKVNATVDIGANARVISDSGDIDIGSRNDVKLDARAVANAYGLAGAPSGKAYINYFGTNTTNVGSGALLLASDPAHGAINVGAGENSAQQASSILAHTAVNLWNKTAIPINSTPDARTNVTQKSTVNLAQDSNLLAGGDIGIAAERGSIHVSAVGIGKDLYREAAGAIAKAVGIDASLDITGGSAPTPGGIAQVNVEGTVLSGLLRQSATQIDPVILTTNPDGSVIWQIRYSRVDSTTNTGLAANPFDPSLPNPYIGYLFGSSQSGQLALGNIQESDVAPNSQLLARITLLQGLRAKYAADPVSSAAYQSEIDFLTKKLGTQGVGQTSVQVTARGAAALDAAGAVDTALAKYGELTPGDPSTWGLISGQSKITGDITGDTRAEQIGAAGGLIANYATIDANNTVIDTNLVHLKNAPTGNALTNDATYSALNANRSQAATDYTNLSTAVTQIGNYSYVCDMGQAGCAAGAPVDAFGNALASTVQNGFRIVSGTGYLNNIQSSMQNISQLALQQGGSGTLSSNISALSSQMNNIKVANTTIVNSVSDMYANLTQAATRQASLSSAWRDPAASGNVDTARVATVDSRLAANSPLVGQFNAATAGTYANVIGANKALIDTAAANIATAVGVVAAADDTLAPAGTQKLLTFPDISVKLGNVNIKADVLAGSGSLQAPGDAKIWILNNTPASMDIANLTVDATGGNVRLDGFLVNNAADVRRFNPNYTGAIPTIVSRENGLAGQPEIKVVSTYDPGAYSPSSLEPAKKIPAAAPDITLGYRVNTGDPDKVISNPNGLVSVTSAAGDIYVDGSIAAGSVSILARNGDFVQQYVNGFNSVAGEPNSNIQGGSGVLPANQTVQPGKGIVANGNVFISARYLNINGLVQSGIVNYHLDIPDDVSLRFVDPFNSSNTLTKAQADALGGQFALYVDPDDPSAIGATYDTATQSIFMTSTAKVHGGNITLFGQIMNTANGTTGGTGKLAVLDGFGQIAVNNASSLPVMLKTIDTGADPDPANPGRGVVGVIDITDVQSVSVVAGQAVMNAIHTVISRNNDQITVKQTGYWNPDGTFNPGDPNNPITTFASDPGLGASPSLSDIQNSVIIQNAASRVTAESARFGTYDPQAGLRYVYTTGTDTSTSYTWVFKGDSFFGTSSLALPPSSVSRTLTSGPNVLSNYNLPDGTYLAYVKPVGATTAHINNLQQDATGATSTSAYQGISNTYQTSSVYTKVREWNDCNWWTLCIASNYTSIWNQVTGNTTVKTNSVKADYPIRIEFMGVNTPSLNVTSSQAGVSLEAGHQLNNRYGDTTINAQSFAAGDASLINTRNLSINSSNGSIGGGGAPVNVFMSGVLNASANQGNVEINQIAGALKVGTVSASGDPTANSGKVVLTSQGDLYGDAGNLISGERIELTSANGAIGGIAGNAGAHVPLNIVAGYTADRGTQRYYGLRAEASGDIGIDVLASPASGPVTDNPSGQLLVDTVVSQGGDVRLTAPGQILDNNPNFTIDTRTWNQLLDYWDSVALRAGVDNTQKLTQALAAYENGHTQNYRQYWQIRNQQNAPTVYDAAWHYTASAAERAALKNDAAAISNFENGRTAQYWALSTEIAGYDANALARGQYAANLKQANPSWTSAQIAARVLADEAAGTLPTVTAGTQVANFIYVASAAERSEQEVGSSWTTSQLALGLNPGLLKGVTDTNPVIKAPNVSGRHVTLVAGTSIGATLPAGDPDAIAIPLDTDGNLTDRQKVALATAEFSDFVFSDPNRRTGTLTISQRLPVNFTATGGLSASVNVGGDSANPLTAHQAYTDLGNIYLASLGGGLIDRIRADGEVRLKTKDLISAVNAGVVAIQAGDLILEAANASIGGDPNGTTPLLVNVTRDINGTADSYGSLTARAAGAINLAEYNDVAIGGIYSRDAITVTSETGSILNARPVDNTGLVLLGGSVRLAAPFGSIGDIALDQPVAAGTNIGTPLSGFIQALAGDWVYIKGPSNPLVTSKFMFGPVVNGADAVDAGIGIKIVAENDVSLNGSVKAPGTIDLIVGGTLTTNATARITGLAGDVNIDAHTLDMQDGSVLDAGTGAVAITTSGDAIVTGITTDNASADAVRVTSTAGRILDGGDTRTDITATVTGAVVTLNSRDGVGTATRLPTGAITATPNPLEINAAMLNSTVIGGGFHAATTGLLSIGNVTASGDIDLSGNLGVGAGILTSTGGGVFARSSNGSVVIGNATASGDIDLSGNLDVGAGILTSTGSGVFARSSNGSVVMGNATASGDIDLSGNLGVGAGTLTSTGGGVFARSSNGSVVIGAINAGAFTLAAPGLIQATVNPVGASLNGAVTGYGGGPAAQANLTINGNVPITFSNFWVNNGNLALAGPAPMSILNGYLGNHLTVTTPVAHVVLDARDPRRENADAKIYVPGNTFNLALANRVLSTNAYILYSGTEFETHSPAGTDVTVESAMLDELAKVLEMGQFRQPGPQGQPMRASIDISGPVVSVGEAMLRAEDREDREEQEDEE